MSIKSKTTVVQLKQKALELTYRNCRESTDGRKKSSAKAKISTSQEQEIILQISITPKSYYLSSDHCWLKDTNQ